MTLRDVHIPEKSPNAKEEAVVSGSNYRFTILSPRAIRLEYAPSDDDFENRASQRIWHRDQEVPEFDVNRRSGRIEIETDRLRIQYDTTTTGFDEDSLSIEVYDEDQTWHYGDQSGDLGGALRTVDAIDGATDLEKGLVSRDGWAVLDDTDSLVFGDNGWVQPRDCSEEYEDLYFFGYGDDYRGCLEEFTDLAGDVPMVPRWALGNWWSRYWEYSQSELRDLVTEFRNRNIPLSVCMIDMDWHVTETEYHHGWTGWTWNEELFPDPAGFIHWLHDNGLQTGLNLHPATGVHPHEEQYEDFAQFMSIDPETETPIEFDAADTQFLRGYFDHLIRPMEERDGMDFWWIDWQQWDESPEMSGLDPLWALNHLHALDRTRDGRRPFILSRWPGLGGHRYPIQFSGDAKISWDSLSFQPYLTSTSANVQCGWWSHDIGGHAGGTGDPIDFGELYARWAQFGAVSPINRIHTTKDAFVDKRPWQFGGTVSDAAVDALRLRHSLIPYLYTMAWRNHNRGHPLIEPMYYDTPNEGAAYACSEQYLFGTELLVAPHVAPRDDMTNLSRRSVWLPDGDWFDFFSGEQYDGGWHTRYGDLDDLPMYAPAGAIVPLGPEVSWGGVESPEALRVRVFPGDDNMFELYEDDGVSEEYRNGDYATTQICQRWDGDHMTINVEPTEGATEHVPDTRNYRFQVRGIVEPEAVDIESPQKVADRVYNEDTSTFELSIDDVPVDKSISIVLKNDNETLCDKTDHAVKRVEELIRTFSLPVDVKAAIEDRITANPENASWLHEFAPHLDLSQRRALVETIFEVGYDRITTAEFDRLLLWNESGREDARYRFTGGSPTGDDSPAKVRHGTIPEFAVIGLDELGPTEWELTVTTGDVAVGDIDESAD